MTAFSGRRYGTFTDRAAAERYLSTIKDPEKRAKTRAGLGLDEQAPETAMQALQRIAGQTTPPQPAPELWHQRNPNGTPTIPSDALTHVSWDLCKEGHKDEGLVPAIQLSLPYPPSVNHYYRSVVKSKKWGSSNPKDYFVTVLISKDGREYHKAVQAAVRQQGSPKTPIGARLLLFIDIHPTNKARIDIDNRVKAVQDALTKAGVWADDCLIDKLIVERKEPRPGGACTVRIVPIMDGRLI